VASQTVRLYIPEDSVQEMEASVIILSTHKYRSCLQGCELRSVCCFLFVRCLISISPFLKMEAVFSTESSVNLRRITGYHFQEDGISTITPLTA
jgi:hypothetical protein